MGSSRDARSAETQRKGQPEGAGEHQPADEPDDDADQSAECAECHRFAQELSADVTAPRANCHANADLTCALLWRSPAKLARDSAEKARKRNYLELMNIWRQ